MKAIKQGLTTETNIHLRLIDFSNLVTMWIETIQTQNYFKRKGFIQGWHTNCLTQMVASQPW
jgi:hypothetical protein